MVYEVCTKGAQALKGFFIFRFQTLRFPALLARQMSDTMVLYFIEALNSLKGFIPKEKPRCIPINSCQFLARLVDQGNSSPETGTFQFLHQSNICRCLALKNMG